MVNVIQKHPQRNTFDLSGLTDAQKHYTFKYSFTDSTYHCNITSTMSTDLLYLLWGVMRCIWYITPLYTNISHDVKLFFVFFFALFYFSCKKSFLKYIYIRYKLMLNMMWNMAKTLHSIIHSWRAVKYSIRLYNLAWDMYIWKILLTYKFRDNFVWDISQCFGSEISDIESLFSV